MKAECQIEKIKNAIMLAEKVTGKNLTLPVLSTILVIAGGSAIKLRATNLNLGIEIEVPAKISKEGVMALSGATLLNLFSYTANGQNVVFEQKGDLCTVTTKNTTANIKTFPYEDFPTIPIIEGQTIELPTKKFLEGIRAVYYSAAISDIKPEIASLYLYADNDTLIFVATDSFRLAEKKVRIKGLYDFPSILIPYKNILEILKILESAPDTITLSVTKTQIALSANGFYLTSRVIDGTFPDYKQIMPKSFSTEGTMLKQDLLNALKITNIFSDKFNQITLVVNPAKKQFELTSKNTDIGENTTQVDTVSKGEEITVAINHKYITDCFQSITSDSVTIGLNGPQKPILVRGVGDDTFMYLIMPMNR